MENNAKWDFIADVIIISWIIELLGPRISAYLLLLISIGLIIFAGFLFMDTVHVYSYPPGDGLEGGWDGMQFWHWDQIDKVWIPESMLYQVVTYGRIADIRTRRYKLSEAEKLAYLKVGYYGGTFFDEEEYSYDGIEGIKETEIVISTKTGKEIWEERKIEIEKENEIKKQKENEIKKQKEEEERKEKIQKQVDEWKEEAKNR